MEAEVNEQLATARSTVELMQELGCVWHGVQNGHVQKLCIYALASVFTHSHT